MLSLILSVVMSSFSKLTSHEFLHVHQKFYLQPIVSPKFGEYWYQPKPLAVNRLKGLVSWLFSKAEIDGSFTNHSLRATGVSTTGVPEALIQKRSGHRSTEALRFYETCGVDTKHSQAISNIFAGKASNFQTEFSKETPQDERFFAELAKALDKEEMDDEAFVDKFGHEIDI